MSEKTHYPEGQDLQAYVQQRNKRSLRWQIIFQISTLVGIIALTALLYNIINGAFGLVAVENQVNDTRSLVKAALKSQLLDAPNSTASEDDILLEEGVAADPYAIGFFGHAYYVTNQDNLRALTIEGVAPTAETVQQGEYPLARPLFVYSSVDLMERKDRVRGFLNYYLTNINAEIEEVGYFPAPAESLAEAKAHWLTANGLPPAEALPAIDPASLRSRIQVVGSSTVFPLTGHLADRFKEDGFKGKFEINSTGTGGGFRTFCEERRGDIVNASRPIKPAELAACQGREREPVEFQIGMDAMVIAVSQENTFLEDVTRAELVQIFTGAELWSDVNPAWPGKPIQHFTPTADSGTLDVFADAVFDQDLADLPASGLAAVLAQNLSTGVYRRLESEQPLNERTREDLNDLVTERIIQPTVAESWSLRDSLLARDKIEARVAEKYPTTRLEFRSWLTSEFIVNPQSSKPELAGVRTAILGTLWVVAITILISFPIGVGAAIYLEEYAAGVKNPLLRRVNEVIQTNINNLAGVPSIIYGILGLAIFVRFMEPITSGAIFGAVGDATTANGRTIISAGATLALLILPLIIINGQEAIRAVPNSLRQASYGLGATHWQTIWNHVLPVALPGILTGAILAVSRAIGETAPLVVIGASTFITVDPESPFAKFTVLPIQIFQWTSRPQAEFRNIAAAAIIVLLILLLTLNASAVILRNRYSRSL